MSTTATRRVAADLELLEEALRFLDEARPAIGHRGTEHEASLQVGGLDDEILTHWVHDLHRCEGEHQPENPTEDEDFPLEQGFAGGRLSPDPDRALCSSSPIG